jgi:hypothetical protein
MSWNAVISSLTDESRPERFYGHLTRLTPMDSHEPRFSKGKKRAIFLSDRKNYHFGHTCNARLNVVGYGTRETRLSLTAAIAVAGGGRTSRPYDGAGHWE